MAPHVFQTPDTGRVCAPGRLANQIASQPIQHPGQRPCQQQLRGGVWVALLHARIRTAEDRDVLAQVLQVENSGFESVIDVGGQVGDFVGEVDQLRFQRRAPIEEIFA